MTYCIDFFRKFKKDGNFCGLDKSQVSRLTAYLEIVELLIKQQIPEEQIYEQFTVHAAEPLISAKGETRTKGLNFVTGALKEGRNVTNKDIQTTLKSCSTATTKPVFPVESCTCATSKPVSKPIQEKRPEPAKEEKPKDPSPQPSLGDRVRAAEIAEAGKNQPAPAAPIAPVLKEKYNPTATPAQPPCLAGKPCLKMKRVGIRGRICDVLGVPINQLPGNRCPFPADKVGAFCTASEFDPATGGRLIKNTPYNVIPVQLSKEQAEAAIASVVRGYLTKAQQGIWESIRKTGELGDTDLEIFYGLVDEAGERVQ